ncbi:SPJ_0845 family protein [Streptococcus halichoeri]|uniref:SPJ_0845 family protein n=1 Tax=Streptococcus halichoeri TaxID=254785 RepID=UPI0019175E59|nr:SPJ_0845 family protein [Streptococcus halichoeri]
MAITHKKIDELEKMMAQFANIPGFDKPLEVDTDGKIIPNPAKEKQPHNEL